VHDDIVAAHNERADLRGAEEQVGPRQGWALEVLRDPLVALPSGAADAAQALEAARSSSVRNALGSVQRAVDEGELTLDGAAERIVAVVRELGLRPVAPPALPEPIGVEDLGIVCWMGVLPAR